jgi:hypothetical protein
VLTQIIESADNFKQRVRRTLPDTLIVMRKQSDELDSARLNERQEVDLGGGEERANGVSGDLLLNGDSAVDVHHLVKVKVVEVDDGIAVSVDFLVDGDGVRGG